jgi:membrane protein YdbS with pleckstrin-like domain
MVMKRIVIKEGPVVFLRNLFLMEFLAAIIFIALSFLDNYGMHYLNLGLGRYLSYDKFLIIAFSLFQLIYILLLFVDWYFRYYEIRDKEIVRSSGFFMRRRKSVSLLQVISVEVSQSLLDRFLKHATLILEHSNGRVTKIRNVAGYEEYAAVIKQMIENVGSRLRDPRTLQMLLKEGEGMSVEFKQTLRHDVRRKEINKDVERAALKTIAGFMNADGGTLVIGVDDEGKVTGLKYDYETLAKKNRDGFENHLTNLIKTMIGMKYANYVRTRFDYFQDSEACIVYVEPAHKPAYIRNGGGAEDFFVRTGNSTQPFSMSEAEEYIKTRWR